MLESPYAVQPFYIMFQDPPFLIVLQERLCNGKKSGPPPYLTCAEEQELVSFLLGCAAIGYPRTRKDVLAIIQDVIDSKGIKRTVTYGWWTGFKKRHDCIALRTAVHSQIVMEYRKTQMHKKKMMYFVSITKMQLQCFGK